ncbi:hypothetical protein F511_12513 [Dorcoceras hygrometricum]|uniref:Uncharacterized protein n=1 Tax=Dorcoceras hygrometricum TaxID=472368 RepID=A0A2Z7DD29_9LAMI|nr:hypothetical protein F511_12513 [Dorcoceras hygrometricum]
MLIAHPDAPKHQGLTTTRMAQLVAENRRTCPALMIRGQSSTVPETSTGNKEVQRRGHDPETSFTYENI